MSVERPGVSLGVDVGKARVGLAASDPDGIMATPVATLKRDAGKRRDVHRIAAIAAERDARRVFVGLPLALSGRETASTQDARDYASHLAAALQAGGVECEVRMVDERLTTVTAQQQLSGVGVAARDQRKIIDQVAAVAILEHALETFKRHGAAGTPLPDAPPHSTGEETL
ncbi:Holliday junction resolvase RuvX [Falsarthrobacter nasiphocae]|uniref:Putative pre-16S rRNA nuclease n=1 Tax=Falsarthrobacter nasiphocae TaxID=189863 RepID=A0AAE4C925_9MICC|nr:Holliday junction resolvase RuvX [Falsarthrobacter nasiphocae]MDR6892975.1 putative Holliday junction resolvase [Falsarthrobacter nasiphocae]